ncbi:sugar lactone lactonase YvrE/DNA-binding IclR family transcriptional regulator [Pseudochelatococcus lubricantis]|uniref:Sugar lactone lactonase YvrE/DNA-binding IclR family transcriptional regulator n=1 Tax=Pseudochelatococcus lubricantis TaxID=1538102 RepID=A0ABX0V418_9HYPH|nr:SMP-30/gluconolactonase/LRE family protein [Pseudochelatococcus lubricantis]NIJ58824.1 sugar lactone lactonase YvrE/DNA-binding IclR family transcriptional regulator [Pseudochelatococcus lubricantis]
MAEKSGTQGVGALLKALDIIELISKSQEPLSIGQIASDLAMPRPTVHRIVAALEKKGLVQLEAQTRGFRLGFHLFELAHKAWADIDLRALARGPLDRLREVSREASVLGVRSGDNFVIVDRRESLFGVRSVVPIGQTAPLASGALGLAILSELGPEVAAEIDDSLTHATARLSDGRDVPFDEVMRRAAARGYAIHVGTGGDGVASVAAPILDYLGRPIAAIGVTGPTSRLTPDHLHALAPTIIDCARRITSNAGNSLQSIEPRARPAAEPGQPEPRCIAANTLLGKTPRWSPASGNLFLADILGPAILCAEPASGLSRTLLKPDMGVLCGWSGPGELVFADSRGVHRLDIATGEHRLAAPLPRGLGESRLNCCGVDPSGGFWLALMSVRARPGEGALLHVSETGIEVTTENLSVPSGMAWSADGRTVFLVDSGRRAILRAAFDAAAHRIGAFETFAEFPASDGSPDGITFDRHGGLWVALWDGWSVVRLSASGEIDRRITLPVPRPTDLCFGGPSNETLFITTARIRLSANVLEEAPLSGSVLTLDLASA